MSVCLSEVCHDLIENFVNNFSRSHRTSQRKKKLNRINFFDIGIPALTRYKSAPSTGVLDITVNTSWLLQKLKKVVKDFQIDSFFLDFGTC